VQSTIDYGKVAEFKITFKPHSVVMLNKVAILFSYPVGLEPSPSDGSDRCTVKSG
jgi:hypothetical protein